MAKASAKKRWYNIVAPEIFNSFIVGETPAIDPKNIEGRIAKINLSTITNDMRKQNTEISLVVNNVQGDSAKTMITGMKIMPNSIKRQVRKGRTRLDQTIKGITKDEKVVTIKSLLITRNVVKGSVFTALQKEAARIILKSISNTNYSSLAEEVVAYKVQNKLKERLNKIYPLRLCLIKEFKLERFMKAVDIRKYTIRRGRGRDC
jgi:ribosomal protein S3AE